MEAERLCGGLGDLRNTENKKLTSTAKHCWEDMSQ